MATQPVFDIPVSVEEYLSTVYEHDCEYVDGVIEERGLCEFEHAYVQGMLVTLFNNHREDWGTCPLPEMRIQTQQRRFRVPDVAVLRKGAQRERILGTPPLLAVEIQSSDDTLRKVTAKSKEYLDFGVESVWVIDPWSRKGYMATPDGLVEVADGVLSIPDTPIRVDIKEIFAEMDQM